MVHCKYDVFTNLASNVASSFFDEVWKIPVIVLPTVRFVGIFEQNLSSNRDVQHYEFRTIKIMTYQYLVIEYPYMKPLSVEMACLLGIQNEIQAV